ncbi:putative regulatory protein, FmdB family [Singulisphaera sp. GP187]|uniref:FmdB family zinc ribbon protein n=1 Tax=Singulisphaera sp. GP187 TaxID=1882752 RepID=UPI00092C3F8F|nr:zinc ribbon domain-containing protein [Singulisphaera sp. GP187]SIO33059.1 putative regulatory protein, FmdB family [Singulisphaera sp. GP187]
MPIYEYHCEPCDHTFETLVRGQGDTPHCPQCGGIDLHKQFSVPASAQAGGRPGSSLPVCGPSPSFGCGSGPCGSGMCSSG